MVGVAPRGERPLVLGLFLLAGCCGLVRVFFLSAAIPIFLERFSLSDLPYTYAGAALFSVGVGLLRGRLERRLDLRTLSVATLGFLVGYCVLLRIGLELPGRAPAFLVGMSIDAVFVLTGLTLWGLANRLLDVRQAKRLFGRIGSGEVLAGLLGGVAAPFIVGFGGTPSLLLACAISAGLGLLVLAYVLRIAAAGLASQERADDEPPPMTLRRRLRDGYVVLIVAYAALCTLCFYFVDAGFVAAAHARHRDAAGLASFLGLFQAAVAVATLTTQLFVVAPLLKRFGVRVYLLLIPAVVFVLTAGVILTASRGGPLDLLIGFMYATKFAMALGWIAIFPTSKLLALQPLPSAARTSVQTLVDAIVEGLAAGVAGLLLIVLAGIVPFTPGGLARVAAPALIGLLVVGVALGKRYARRVERAVTVRALPEASIALTDAATLRVLVAGLDSERPEHVVFCIDRLEQAGHPQYAEHLLRLVRHPVAEVRTDGLLRIERLLPIGARAAIEERLTVERDPHVVGIALRVLSAAGGEAVVDRMTSALDDPSPEVCAGALLGLLRHGGANGHATARRQLLRLAADEQPENRALAARVIGDVDQRACDELLGGLLDDPDPAVRRAALEAAGRLGRAAFWPAMLASLVSSTAPGAAAAALADVGEPVLSFLGEEFSGSQGAARLAIARVLCAIAGRPAGDLLERVADDANAEVRARVLRSLAERGRRLEAGRGEALLDRERALAVWLGATRRSLERGCGAPAIVLDALAEEIALSRERMLLVLALLYEGPAMLRACEAYTTGGGERSAYAIELLDLSLAARHKAGVLPLLEDREEASGSHDGHAHPPWGDDVLCAILGETSLNTWTRVCAIHCCTPTTGDGLAAVRRALNAPEAIVREAAASTLAGNETENKMLIVEKALVLRRTSMFEDTPGHVLARVAEAVEHVEYAAGAVVIREGETGSSMFVIATGAVKVVVNGEAIDAHGPGEVIGELATLDPRPRTATVIATEESILLRLTRSVLFELMSERVEVAHAIVRFLIRRYKERPASDISTSFSHAA